MPTLDALDAAMLRTAQTVPAVALLGGGQISLAGKDQPWRIVGTESVIYQLRQPTGRVLALRCPLSDTHEATISDRYRALATDPSVKSLREGEDAPIIGQVAYLPEGITLPGSELRSVTSPLIAMEWVMGPTLMAAVDRNCRAGNHGYLAALSDAWVTVMTRTNEAGFSHGDLTPDNVMVRPNGWLVLIDYDTCAWPTSPGAPIPRGTLGYAHPKASAETPVAKRDNFSAFVIYTTLRVLAEHPRLREEHGAPSGKPDGELFFSAWDLVNPDTSQLFAMLRGLVREPATEALIEALKRACAAAPSIIAPLADIVEEFRPVTPRRGRGTGALGTGALGTGQLSGGAPGKGRGGSTGPLRGRSGGSVTPRSMGEPERYQDSADLTPDLTQRKNRLNSLLLAGNEDAAQRYWRSSGLHHDPDAVREMGGRMEELERRRAVKLAREAAEHNDTVAFLKLWERHQFDDYRPAQPLRPVARVARRRTEAASRLRAAVSANDVEAITELWPQLRGDSLVSDLAIQVADVLQGHFGKRMSQAVTRGADDLLITEAREAERSGVVLTTQSRKAVRAALSRQAIRARLERAIEENDRTELSDLVLSGRIAELGALEPQTAQMAVRALHWPYLDWALSTDQDETIVNAYDPDVFDDDDTLSPARRARVDLARRRIEWLRIVRAALKSRHVVVLTEAMAAIPPEAMDRLTQVERRRVERLTSRDDAARELATALERGVDKDIMAALGRVAATGASLPEAIDWAAVNGVVDRVTLADAIRDALVASPPDYPRLARLLPAARAAAEADQNLVDGVDFAELERDVLRATHLSRLRNALASDDDREILAAAVPDPFGVIESLSPERRDRVENAIRNRRGTDRLRPTRMPAE